MKTQSDPINKVWLNYYQIEQTAKTDLLQKQIGTSSKQDSNILIYPYNCIGLLKYTNPNRGISLNGTAYLIDSDLVLTTADNIFSKQDDCHFKQLYFFPPTFNSSEMPIKVREYRFEEEYIKNESHDALCSVSLALLKLDRPVYRPKYLEIKYDFSHEENPLSLYGYPKPVTGLRMFGKEGRIIKIKDNLIIHSIISEPGQSGSPLFVNINDRIFTIGIHFGVSNHYGIGFLITKEAVTTLNRWEREMIVSNVKYSSFEPEQKEHTHQIYTFLFNTVSMELDSTQVNWKPLQVQWEASSEQSDKFIIDKNKITRQQISFFDNRHRQVTTKIPLQKQGKFFIKAKVIKYGNKAPYDSIYFGVITQKHKKHQNSDGRHRGSIAYTSSSSTFESTIINRGAILMDGVQMAYGDDLFLDQGDQVKIEINTRRYEVTFINKRKKITIKVSPNYGKKNLYLFTTLASHQSCVSWHSADGEVWN